MPVTIIVGGQLGSEGKGKVASEFVKLKNADAVVRCGGTNAGHTDNLGVIRRQLPVRSKLSILSAGSYIDLKVLYSEMQGHTLIIDPFAVIISEVNKCNESGIKNTIGSTGSGTGGALLSRIKRDNSVVFAKDVPEVEPFVHDTVSLMRSMLDSGCRLIIEGTQGFGLSLLHSQAHPFVTSRDTTASGFLSEVGLSPFDVDEVVMVIRSYPIRVAGNSGPMYNETTWGEISVIPEITSVSKRIRRVGFFDYEMVKRAIKANKPNIIVLNHLDYIEKDFRCAFVQNVEKQIGQKINFIGADKFSITPV